MCLQAACALPLPMVEPQHGATALPWCGRKNAVAPLDGAPPQQRMASWTPKKGTSLPYIRKPWSVPASVGSAGAWPVPASYGVYTAACSTPQSWSRCLRPGASVQHTNILAATDGPCHGIQFHSTSDKMKDATPTHFYTCVATRNLFVWLDLSMFFEENVSSCKAVLVSQQHLQLCLLILPGWQHCLCLLHRAIVKTTLHGLDWLIFDPRKKPCWAEAKHPTKSIFPVVSFPALVSASNNRSSCRAMSCRSWSGIKTFLARWFFWWLVE